MTRLLHLVDPDRSASPAHTGLADSDTATRHLPAAFFVPTVQIPMHVGQFVLLTELVFHNAYLRPLIYDLI